MSEYQFSSLPPFANQGDQTVPAKPRATAQHRLGGAALSGEIGRASCRERV